MTQLQALYVLSGIVIECMILYGIKVHWETLQEFGEGEHFRSQLLAFRYMCAIATIPILSIVFLFVSIPAFIMLTLIANFMAGLMILTHPADNLKIMRELAESESATKALANDLESSNKQLRALTEELKEARDAAEDAARVKSAFLANISHELRTPLNGILGYAQILRHGSQQISPEKQESGLKVIEQSGRHLLNLINEVLELSKIEAGKIEFDEDSFAPKEVFEEVNNLIRVQTDKKKLEFQTEITGQHADYLRGDAKRLRQVLLNLLSNATKFTESGSIHLSVDGRLEEAAGQASLAIRVKDTGVGISDDQLTKIFQPFEQLSYARRNQEGTGLGLTISRNIVQLMGGDLTVSSELGEGSCFEFEICLPIADAPGDEGVKSLAQKVTGYDGPRLRILIVDDVAPNRQLLIDILGPLGFELEQASDGRAALSAAESFKPNLILTDIVMPELSGVEVAQTLRESQGEAELKIIAVSASITEDPKTLISEGFDDYLRKPIEIGILLATLEKHLPLQWIVAKDLGKGPETKLLKSGDIPLPDDEVLKTIATLADDGDFMELQRVLDELTAGGEFRSFRKKIMSFVEDFEEERILEFLKARGFAG